MGRIGTHIPHEDWLGVAPELVLVRGKAAELLRDAGLNVGLSHASVGSATMSAVWCEQLSGWFADYLDTHGDEHRERVVRALAFARTDTEARDAARTLLALGSVGQAAIHLLRSSTP